MSKIFKLLDISREKEATKQVPQAVKIVDEGNDREEMKKLKTKKKKKFRINL